MPPPLKEKSEVVSIDAYVRQIMANAAHRQRTQPPLHESLTDIIRAWFESLPIVTRHRRYQLVEISDAVLGRTGKRYADRRITASLESMGWSPGRSWTRAGRNRRWHLPPATPLRKEKQ